jgi:peptide deformylase
MSILKVARMGHPVLRTKTPRLDHIQLRSREVQGLIDSMIETMNEYHGIGLAAPQVHESLRLFVAGIPNEDEDENDEDDEPPKVIVVVNPEIIPIGSDVVEGWEGCLSIPEIRGMVPRPRDILLRGYDRRGSKMELKATGFFARVLQHESDHLDGILFFDRMTSLESLTYLDEFVKYHRD